MWRGAPPDDFIKINVDATYVKSLKVAGVKLRLETLRETSFYCHGIMLGVVTASIKWSLGHASPVSVSI